jgi:hypothetical protein
VEPDSRVRRLSSCRCDFAEYLQLLPFSMSISCSTGGIRPLLSSSFYDASVSCNLVDSRLEGAFETIDVNLQRKDYSKFAIVMSKRRPKLGP